MRNTYFESIIGVVRRGIMHGINPQSVYDLSGPLSCYHTTANVRSSTNLKAHLLLRLRSVVDVLPHLDTARHRAR